MGVECRVDEAEGRLTIGVTGRFDVAVKRDFRAAYEQQPATGIRYVVDLSQTTYLDSAALGMLLLLREYAGEERASITLQGARPNVRWVLEMANFDRLFSLA